MDDKNYIKKYWFVGIVALVLIVFIGIYAKDYIDNKEVVVSSKQVDNKYVVYSVDGQDVLADDFYDSLYKVNGLSTAFMQYQRSILNSAYETTEQMNIDSASYATYIYQTYGPDYADNDLKQMGYTNGASDLPYYYIDAQKQNLLLQDYVTNHYDEVCTDFVAENDPRIVAHILINVADVTSNTDETGKTTYTANPTKEETDKLNAVLEALKTRDFADVAKEFSDDTSNVNGGYIGCVSNGNTGDYYPVFSDGAMKLQNDEVSDPIVSQKGYHIIKNLGNSKDLLVNDSTFVSLIVKNNQTISIKAVLEKADALGYKIVDPDLQKLIDAQVAESEVQE